MLMPSSANKTNTNKTNTKTNTNKTNTNTNKTNTNKTNTNTNKSKSLLQVLRETDLGGYMGAKNLGALRLASSNFRNTVNPRGNAVSKTAVSNNLSDGGMLLSVAKWSDRRFDFSVAKYTKIFHAMDGYFSLHPGYYRLDKVTAYMTSLRENLVGAHPIFDYSDLDDDFTELSPVLAMFGRNTEASNLRKISKAIDSIRIQNLSPLYMRKVENGLGISVADPRRWNCLGHAELEHIRRDLPDLVNLPLNLFKSQVNRNKINSYQLPRGAANLHLSGKVVLK